MKFLIFLEGIRNPFWNAFFLFVTNLDNELFFLALLCIIYWCFSKKMAVHATATYFLSGTICHTLKLVLRIERPWVLDPNFHPVEAALPAAPGYSFPSGHTQAVAAILGSFSWYIRKKKYALIPFLLVIPIGFSRMYLGCHTLADVLSAILISVCSIVIIEVTAKYFTNKTIELVLALLFCVISIGCGIYALSLVNSGTVTVRDATTSMTVCGASIGFTIGCLVERHFIQFKMPTSKKQKILRAVLGLITVVVVYVFLGLFFKGNLIYHAIKYAIVLFIIIAGYPFLFTKIRWFAK